MQRRDFLGALALATTAFNLASCTDDSEATDTAVTPQSELETYAGAVTL